MSVAHDDWSRDADWPPDWRGSPKIDSFNFLVPSARFMMFAFSAIVAGAVLALVT
jgi:hypothetical protein